MSPKIGCIFIFENTIKSSLFSLSRLSASRLQAKKRKDADKKTRTIWRMQKEADIQTQQRHALAQRRSSEPGRASPYKTESEARAGCQSSCYCRVTGLLLCCRSRRHSGPEGAGAGNSLEVRTGLPWLGSSLCQWQHTRCPTHGLAFDFKLKLY